MDGPPTGEVCIPTMTTVRQLHELQELDLQIGQAQDGLSAIYQRLGDREELESANRQVEDEKARLGKMRSQQGSQEQEADSLREKVRGIEGRLYGGEVTSLREMEGFEKEAGSLRESLLTLDEGLLETMVAIEEGQEQLAALEERLREAESTWQRVQAELMVEGERLEESVKGLDARRQGFVSRIGQMELKLYEELRVSKAGVAVARVERGLCRACSVSLPTHLVQRAKREPMQCASCGRILFVS